MPGHHQEQLLTLQMCGRSKRAENAFFNFSIDSLVNNMTVPPHNRRDFSNTSREKKQPEIKKLGFRYKD